MGSQTSSLPTATALLAVLLLSSLVPTALAHGVLPAGVPQAPLAAFADSPSSGTTPAVPGALPTRGLVPAPFGQDPSGLLPALPWESANSLRVVSGTPWVPLMIDGKMVDADEPIRGSMDFWCPSDDGGTTVNDGTNTMTIRADCPYRIIDDADLMGSPQIALNANDPDSVAFFSLHGAGTTEGPTPRSRDPNPEGLATLTGLSHTTFTSQDQGVSWYDNPWGTDGFGEHITGVMDADGNLYIAALWSKRLGDGEFDYTIKVYKEQDGRFQISNYQPSKTFPNRAAGNTIDQANLVYVPAQSVFPLPPDDGNQTGNVTAPADEGDLGNATDPDNAGERNHPDDRVILVWHEKALDWRNATTEKSAWIDAAWTDTTARDNWTRLAKDQLIGPCMATSNPVQWNGKAYVACVVDAGYRARSRAHIGDIDIFSIDPLTGKTQLVAFSQLEGGQPVLTARPDGYMALTTTRRLSEDIVDVSITFGWYGTHWSSPFEAGSALHNLASNTGTSGLPPGTPRPPPASNSVREARITAMALSENPEALYLVYMERVNVAQTPDDPANDFISPDSAIEYKKIVATFTECEGPTNVYDLRLGVARHPFAEAIVGNETGVFDDLQDGMQTWKAPDIGDEAGKERIYFAYGDHGVIQYGALETENSPNLSVCPNPPPAPFLPAQVIPAGLSATSPYTTLVGTTVGLTATSMVAYILAVKRKTAAALAAKAK